MTTTADMAPPQLTIDGERVGSRDGLDVVDPATGQVFIRVSAVTRANATDFGPGASVWSADLEAAEAVARRLDAGSVRVDQHPMLSPEAPFWGRKQSGVGVESSLLGLHAHTDVSVLRIQK